MNGTLMTVIGLFIMLSAFAGGWVSDRFGKRRVVALSGLVSAIGACMVLGAIWVPKMATGRSAPTWRRLRRPDVTWESPTWPGRGRG
jgi:MFS family permease